VAGTFDVVASLLFDYEAHNAVAKRIETTKIMSLFVRVPCYIILI
jgi:hypothetical protein